MRVPLEWLGEYCDPQLDAHELAERLALTGTEVERVEHHGVQALEYFVVGHVLERRKHPDADRLSVCMVDVGRSTPAQIVCGAPNVQAGQTVAVSRPGAIMPDGTRLQKAKLRGQTSDGMILAEDEVGIGSDHGGIMVLPDGLTPGSPLQAVLPIATDVLVLEITPNRPDCLGIYGIAREVHAATGAPLQPPPWATDPGTEGPAEGAEILNEAGPDLCPRFTARIYDDVKLGPSPIWLKARLMAAGQRPISNVVDISNYVMLLTGQPTHAYDLTRVGGHRLTVRRAIAGETAQTLDDQTRTLDGEMVVIDDDQGPTGIAGVMGGARSEVADDTEQILFEAATWNGPNVHRTSLKLGLRSEASTRFEKQLQPEQTLWAQAVASQLMIELCGARLRPGTIDVGGPGPQPPAITLRQARMTSLLGMEISTEKATEILNALDFETAPARDGLQVTPPVFRRADISREPDVIEEVARLYGLDRLPATLPARRSVYGTLTDRQRLIRTVGDALIAQGLHEIVGWSFTGPHATATLRLPADRAVTLANPLSGDLGQLRTTLLTSLLDVARRNRAHGAQSLRLFEMGAVYLRTSDGELPREPQHAGALLRGPLRPPTWRDPSPDAADFFAIKGVLGALLDSLGISWALHPGTQSFLHPGRSARIDVAGRQAGWLGELHPTIASEWELPDKVALFELDLDVLPIPATAVYTDLTSFPEVREDLAVVVAEDTPAAQVLETLERAGAPLLEHAEVFDVYRDPERLGEGRKSLAIRLAFRAADRTLTDQDVARQRQKIAAALEEELGGRVRDSR
ncbi:MAG TPA: phenylalanine--tRNA ligase subunit beta [Solirubrobacteraceae bacterium]|nr:phenylalanine--tRNA ligase subunit beta [Solirubrobacteraceae bacterium]